MSTPAGWYADPSDTRGLRWWSGLAWTEHVAAAQPPAPAPAPAPAYGVPQPYSLNASRHTAYAAGDFPDPKTMKRGAREKQLRRVNPVAYAGIIVALVGLILSFWGLAGIAAIILSSIGLARASRLRTQGHLITGQGYSVAGLVIGIVGVLFQFGMFIVRIVESPAFQAGFQSGLHRQ